MIFPVAVIYTWRSTLRGTIFTSSFLLSTSSLSLSLSLASVFLRLNYNCRLRNRYRYREVFRYGDWHPSRLQVDRYFYTELVDLISLGRKADIDYTCVLQLLVVIHHMLCFARNFALQQTWMWVKIFRKLMFYTLFPRSLYPLCNTVYRICFQHLLPTFFLYISRSRIACLLFLNTDRVLSEFSYIT